MYHEIFRAAAPPPETEAPKNDTVKPAVADGFVKTVSSTSNGDSHRYTMIREKRKTRKKDRGLTVSPLSLVSDRPTEKQNYASVYDFS